MAEDNSLFNLHQYFAKLKKEIEENAGFKLGNKSFVDKQRTDDILCCIDVNFPEKLKKFREKFGDFDKNIRCFRMYQELINNIKIKPPLGNSSYAVNRSESLELIDRVEKCIIRDAKHLEENYPNL